MRFTLFKYISREIWPVFFVSLMVFVFIILAANIISIMDMVINQGVSLLQFLQIVLCMLPQVILFSLPVTCLMSVMLAFIRLGSDNEIIALNASGISLYQMLAPVISFSITSLIIAVFFTMCAVPWGNRTYKDYLTGIIKSKANLDISERSFYHDLKNVVFYVNAYSQKDKEMTGVFGVDRSKEDVTNTIVAEKGRIVKSENKIYVYFNNGTIFTNKTASKEVTTFRFPKEYKWSYDLGDIAEKIATREKKPKELYLSELVKGLKARDTDPSKKNQMGVNLYEMFSIPAAIFILGIIGACLGSHVKARGRTIGVVISLFIFLLYYSSLMGARYLCEMGLFPPSIGVWTPVFILTCISVTMLLRVRKNDSFNLSY